MSHLHLRQSAPDALKRTLHITPETAGWDYVGFDLHKLAAGETVSVETGDREVCLVFLAGRGKVEAAGEDFGTVGERMSVFEGKPWSVYVPAGSRVDDNSRDRCRGRRLFGPGHPRQPPAPRHRPRQPRGHGPRQGQQRPPRHRHHQRDRSGR